MRFGLSALAAVALISVVGCTPNPNGESGLSYVMNTGQPDDGKAAAHILTYQGSTVVIAPTLASQVDANIEWMSYDKNGDGVYDTERQPGNRLNILFDKAGVFTGMLAVKMLGSDVVTLQDVTVEVTPLTPLRRALIEDYFALWCGPCGSTYTALETYLAPMLNLNEKGSDALVLMWQTDQDYYGWGHLPGVDKNSYAQTASRANELTGPWGCYPGSIPFMTMDGSMTSFNGTSDSWQSGLYCGYRSYVPMLSDTTGDWIDLVNEVNTIPTDMAFDIKASIEKIGGKDTLVADISFTATASAAVTGRTLRLYATAHHMKNNGVGATSTPTSSFGGTVGPVAIGEKLIPLTTTLVTPGKTTTRRFTWTIDKTKQEWNVPLTTADKTTNAHRLGVAGMIVDDSKIVYTGGQLTDVNDGHIVNAAADIVK